VRGLLIVALVACGGSAPTTTTTTTHAPSHVKHHDRAPVDPIAALEGVPGETSYVVPGAASLDLGGTRIDAPDGGSELMVQLLDEAGDQVRVGVRAPRVRFALWMPRAQLLGVITRDVVVSDRASTPSPAFGVDADAAPAAHLVKPAFVRRFDRKNGWTHVRYVGAFEIDGWVPDDAVSDRMPPVDHGGGGMFFHSPRLVTPGAAIRAEPRWGGRVLAAVAGGYRVDEVRVVDKQWLLVGYMDMEMSVRGFLDPQAPPVATHRRAAREVPVPQVATNGTAPDKTCLYANAGGEPIGFIEGGLPAAIDRSGRDDWWTVAIDTAWGPIAFFAHGATVELLAACGKQ
jgi:hypothetical protein